MWMGLVDREDVYGTRSCGAGLRGRKGSASASASPRGGPPLSDVAAAASTTSSSSLRTEGKCARRRVWAASTRPERM